MRRLLSAAAISLMLAMPAAAQTRQAAAISVSQDDLALRYITDGHSRLNDSGTKDARFFLLDIAYNIKLWHMGLNRTVTCNGLEYPVQSIQVEGLHVYDNGTKGTVYYGAEFEPQGVRGKDEVCRSGSLMLPIERLSDDDWYVPTWGLRLVKRR